MPAISTTRSVERALALLSVICEDPDISLSDAARAVGLPPSSAHRLLGTLAETGYVARAADGRYVVGPQMVRLSGHVLAGNSLRRLCRPTMADLAEETEESIYLSVRSNDRALYIGLVTGSQAVQHRSWEGQTLDLHSSAAGRALTGRLGEDRFLVVSSAVEPDVTAIATPITAGGEIVAALSMVVPNYRLTDETARRFGALIADRAAKLSESLGSRPAPRPLRRSVESARRLAKRPHGEPGDTRSR